MKALKEKRIGFRSLLRRGLVILSLFALIFAVACGGNEGGNTEPGTGEPGTGEPGTGDPGTETKTVTSLVVTTHPTAISFQGLAPDLTGLKGAIVWSDGTREDIDVANMVTDPPFIDYAKLQELVDITGTSPNFVYTEKTGLTLSDGSFSVYVKDHPEKKAPVILPKVIPYASDFDDKGNADPNDDVTAIAANALVKVGDITGEWYSDEVPSFEGASLVATYEDYMNGTTYVKAATKSIPITGAYPPLVGISTLDAHGDPTLTLGLGYDSTKGNALTLAAYQKTIGFEHANYVRASGITVNADSITGEFFDDDVDLVLDTVDADKDQTRIMGILKEAGVTMSVNYYDKEEPRTKTIDQLMSAIDFYNAFLPTVNKISYVASTGQPDAGGVLPYVEGDAGAYFTVRLNYVPVIWGTAQNNTGSDAWVSQFGVDLPVYTFTGDVYASRKANTGTNNITAIEEAASPWGVKIATEVSGDKGYDLLVGLQSKWELTGVYERGTAQAERKIPLTKQMFADGIADSRPVTIDPDNTNIFTLNGNDTSYDWAGLDAKEIGANYVLPIYYREVELLDVETGVLVDLEGVGP